MNTLQVYRSYALIILDFMHLPLGDSKTLLKLDDDLRRHLEDERYRRQQYDNNGGRRRKNSSSGPWNLIYLIILIFVIYQCTSS